MKRMPATTTAAVAASLSVCFSSVPAVAQFEGAIAAIQEQMRRNAAKACAEDPYSSGCEISSRAVDQSRYMQQNHQAEMARIQRMQQEQQQRAYHAQWQEQQRLAAQREQDRINAENGRIAGERFQAQIEQQRQQWQAGLPRAGNSSNSQSPTSTPEKTGCRDANGNPVFYPGKNGQPGRAC